MADIVQNDEEARRPALARLLNPRSVAIAAIARENDMAIEGPNCLGFVNHADRIALTFAAADPRPLAGPGIAVVSQSGAMAAVVQAALHSHDLDVTLSVSTGNEATHG